MEKFIAKVHPDEYFQRGLEKGYFTDQEIQIAQRAARSMKAWVEERERE